MSLIATVFNISRASLHDGPGVRTVVYFKGCNLSCPWCHNPEGLSSKKEISFLKVKCIGCGKCMEVCPDCHTPSGFDRTHCVVCGRCADVCTAKALEIVGKEYTVDALFEEIKKDEAYFRHGGGITVSGGECLLQADFVSEFLRACKDHNIHTLIESAFFVPSISIEKVLPYADEFYVDCKIFDNEKHVSYIGASNAQILKNIRLFATKTRMTLRIPLIPHINDDVENLCNTVEFAKEAGALRVELLRFNPLGLSKYETVGKEGRLFGKEAQEKAYVEKLVKELNEFAKDETFVYCSF